MLNSTTTPRSAYVNGGVLCCVAGRLQENLVCHRWSYDGCQPFLGIERFAAFVEVRSRGRKPVIFCGCETFIKLMVKQTLDSRLFFRLQPTAAVNRNKFHSALQRGTTLVAYSTQCFEQM